MPRGARSSTSELAIKVTVNGERVDFGDTVPVMQGSRILVPLRGVFEKLGASVVWNPATRTVTAVGGAKRVALTLGAPSATIDGQPVKMDQPAMSIDNRTFVPLRFLSQALGAEVNWLTADRTVEIRTAD